MQKLANEKIGQFAQRVMVSTDLKNADILKLIGEQFPEAKTTMACIAWYRSDLKKKPVQVREVTLESIDLKIKEAEENLEFLKMERHEFLEANKAKLEERKAELKAQLEALENI